MAFTPVVVEDAPFGVAMFLTLFACMALILLRAVWAGTFGALFDRIASALGFLHSVGLPFGGPSLGGIPDAFLHINNFVFHLFGVGIAASEWAWHELWGKLAYVTVKTGDELAAITYDVLAWAHVVHGKVNAAQAVANGALVQAKVAATKVVVAAPKPVATRTAVDHYPELVARLAKLEHTVARIHPTVLTLPALTITTHTGAAIGAEAGTLVGPIAHAPTYDDIWNDVRSRMRKWAGVASVSGIAALIGATIFKQFRLGWLRCPGVGRVGRALCGASGLIETLFSDAIEALVVTDLCQVIAAMSYAAKKFEPVLIAFVDVEDALIGCHGATKPELLNVPALSLPPLTGYVTA